jgi:pyruvate kinase
MAKTKIICTLGPASSNETIIRKMIIKKCNRAQKIVITATQMLESMTEDRIPTRAEVSDVANAIIDGTDCVMLSAESAVGKYPVRTVSMMDNIIKFTESYLKYPSQKLNMFF